MRHHLLLIKTATRRDINDEETAINLARTIRKADRLKMLFLLTVADSIATGPNAWNDWSFTLLRTLFLTVLGILEKGELASSRAVKVVRHKKEALLASAADAKAAEALETLFQYMSPRYLLFVRVRDLQEHVRLYDTLGQAPFVWQITKSTVSGTRKVTICAKDRPGLFASIAGVFTLNGIDILDAQIFTWKNNTALDIFEVKPPPDQLFEAERWERAAGPPEGRTRREPGPGGGAQGENGRLPLRWPAHHRPAGGGAGGQPEFQFFHHRRGLCL